MKLGSSLSILPLALLAFAAACERVPPKNDEPPEPATTPALLAPSASAVAPLASDPAPAPSGSATKPGKAVPLSIKVVTGSEKGFLVTSTIVSGEHDAVLIDAQFTLADGKKVADAILATKKNLKTVYVTHFHPDHYFGFPAIRERFPDARLVALPSTVVDIEHTWQAKVKQWQPMYKDSIPSKPIIPTRLATNSLELEGQKLEIVGGVQGDCPDGSYVWIPWQKTLIAGDIVYDGVFPWTAETSPESRAVWVTTLDKLLALKPDKVVPGHMKPDKKLDRAGIKATKEYLEAFDATLDESKGPSEFETKLKTKYPNLALPVIAKIGAEAAFPVPGAGAPK